MTKRETVQIALELAIMYEESYMDSLIVNGKIAEGMEKDYKECKRRVREFKRILPQYQR